MPTEGNNGGFDGKDIRPDFKAGLKNTLTPERLGGVLAGIDFFATKPDKFDEVGRQISSVLTDVLGSPYSSFDEISKVASRKENTSEVKRAKEFKELVVEGVDLALRQKRESGVISDDELYLGSAHLTNSLHEVMKGVGPDVSSRYVGDKKLDEILNRLESSRVRRGDDSNDPGSTELLLQRIDIAIPKVLGSDTDEADCTVIALNRERRRLHEELGYEPNTRVGSVTTTEQSKSRTSKKTDGDGEKKPRAPSPTVRLESTMGDVNQTIVDASTRIVTAVNTGAEGAKDLGEKVDRLTGVVEEGVKVGEDTVESMRDLSDGVYGLKDVVSENTAATDNVGGKIHRTIGAIEDNTVSMDKNTTGMEKLTGSMERVADSVDKAVLSIDSLTDAANNLGVDVRRLNTTIERSQVMKIFADLESKGVDLSGVSDDEKRVIADVLGREIPESDFKSYFEYVKVLKAYELKVKNGKDSGFEDKIDNRERWNGNLDILYRWLDEIESGDRSVDDLSTNSSKFSYLYHAKNGEYDGLLAEQIKKMITAPSFLTGDEKTKYIESQTKIKLSEMKTELSMRLYLHTLSMAMSKCSTIEDIMRVVSTMHEGDYYGDLDKTFVSFFLKKGEERKGVGLYDIPVDLAWDLRQKGYFKIEELFNEINDNRASFVHFIAEQLGGVDTSKSVEDSLRGKDGYSDDLVSLYKKIIVSKNGRHFLKKEVWDGIVKLSSDDVELKKNPRFGMFRDIYQNWFGMEKKGGTRAVLIKEYMIWKIMSEGGCDRKKAEKAFELAKKFSVATKMDSGANLAFAQDDYAEIINYRFLRYADGPGMKSGMEPKNKPVGSPDTIGLMNSLTCHWMYLLRNNNEIDVDGNVVKMEVKTKRGRELIDKPKIITSTYSPLYCKDIDMSKYSQTTAMPYHFFGVVGSQVEFIKEAFSSKFSPKDVMSPTFINKVYAKINKTVSDMCRARVMAVNFADLRKYDGLWHETKTKEGKKIFTETELSIRREARKVWLLNVFRMAADPYSDWTSDAMEKFISGLKYNPNLLNSDKDGQLAGYGGSFIPVSEIRSAVRDTRVLKILRGRDRMNRVKKYRNPIVSIFGK